jgi:hypothetical protein
MAEKGYPAARGKQRRPLEVPLFKPDVDIDGLMNFTTWRDRYYKKPILDDLTGYYQFVPTVAGVEAYARPKMPRIPQELLKSVTGREDVRGHIQKRREHEAARERQRLHIAASAELATAVFWAVAFLRETVLLEAIGKISENQQPEWDVAVYAADAIQDFGLCLEKPVETEPMFVNGRGGKRLTNGLRTRLDGISPDLGTHVANFGAYAVEHPDALRSADGVALMQTTLEEQNYRKATWEPRHRAVVDAFPDLPQSEEILLFKRSLPELLSIQDNLSAA